MKQCAFYAPFTIANVGPGFDILGLASDGLGDVVEAEETNEFKGVRLVKIVGNDKLPFGRINVVEAVGQRILEESKENRGIGLTLYKNMPIKSGLGSSASSSVSGGMAVNGILEKPFEKDSVEMLRAVIHGEAIATKGLGHADNVFPSLLGGYVLIHDFHNLGYIQNHGGNSCYFVVVSPNLATDTGEARRKLKESPYDALGELPKLSGSLLKNLIITGKWNEPSPADLEKIVIDKSKGNIEIVREYIEGSRQVMEGLMHDDPYILGSGVGRDYIVTPIRAKLIKGYESVVKAALNAGATGISICGSGPAMFSVASQRLAETVAEAKIRAWRKEGVESKAYIAPINNIGARQVA